MDATTFRCQWRIVGGRAVASTFGRIDVADSAITARSTGWSWWIKDQIISKTSIEGIKSRSSLQITIFVITHDKGKQLEFCLAGANVAQMTRQLVDRGFVVDNLLT